MKIIMKNDCAILEAAEENTYWSNKLFLVTDCEGNEYSYSSLTWAKKKFEKITKIFMR